MNTDRYLKPDKHNQKEDNAEFMDHFEKLAMEMDLVIEDAKHKWTNEDFNENIRNSLMTPGSDFRRSQQNFNHFHSVKPDNIQSKEMTGAKTQKSEFPADLFLYASEEVTDRMAPTE